MDGILIIQEDHIIITNIHLRNGKVTIPSHSSRDLRIKTIYDILNRAGLSKDILIK